MSKSNIFGTSWIEIVFENRNKEYGAYYLRQENTKTSLFALFMGALLMTSAISIPALYNFLNPENVTTAEPTISDPVVVTKFEAYVPPQTKAEEPMPQIEKKITENINTNAQLINPVIVQASLATPEKLASNIELKDNPNTSPTNTGSTGIGTGSTSGTAVASTPAITDSTILSSNAVDKMPEFPGGIKKFYTYVGNNFEKPDLETENAIRVSVSFVIEKDGSMTDIKVLKDPGYGLGAEAIRVLKSLKTKWSPGMFEGKAVRTSYNLPITIQPN